MSNMFLYKLATTPQVLKIDSTTESSYSTKLDLAFWYHISSSYSKVPV